MRALRALDINPTICHMNDGHPAFLALERIRMAMREQGISFHEARVLTSAGNVFTTHTPVPAGIDLFPPHFMDHYFGAYYQDLGINRDEFLQLGRPPNPHPDENFSMAILALRLSASANGVSRRHGEVARDMWRELWPGMPAAEVPITSITNGVHSRTWVSHDMASLLFRYLGPRWIERPEDTDVWERVERIPDEELWHTHERRRERLVAVARDRVERQWVRRGSTTAEVAHATEILHPDVLTIGFARRFATYKRAMLLFRDPDRLSRILNNPDRPVQILFAGKAHPRDNPGKEFIRQIIHMARREDLRRRVIFLEDYDMELARYLVQGVDVWLNTPQQGMEASGTSGIKAAMNGIINLSVLDGWWVEAYSPQTGWRIGSGEAQDDEQYRNDVEAETLYDLLEKDVVPLFYERGTDGLPHGWIARMKQSMGYISPVFTTHRMVREYAERLYFPSATRHTLLTADDHRITRDVVSWSQRVHAHWGNVQVLSVESDAHDGTLVRSIINVTARIALGALKPDDVRVQIYHGSIGMQDKFSEYQVVDMTPEDPNQDGIYQYTGSILCADSGEYGYTLRVLPHHPHLGAAHMPGLVVWAS
jgi:starch phosphorylase